MTLEHPDPGFDNVGADGWRGGQEKKMLHLPLTSTGIQPKVWLTRWHSASPGPLWFCRASSLQLPLTCNWV